MTQVGQQRDYAYAKQMVDKQTQTHFPLLELPVLPLYRIAELLPDIATLVSWKRTCKKLKVTVDCMDNLGDFVRKEIFGLKVDSSSTGAGLMRPVVFEYMSKSRNQTLSLKTQYWNPGRPDEVPLNVLTRHWKIVTDRLGIIYNVVTVDAIIDFLVNSRKNWTSERLLGFHLRGEDWTPELETVAHRSILKLIREFLPTRLNVCCEDEKSGDLSASILTDQFIRSRMKLLHSLTVHWFWQAENAKTLRISQESLLPMIKRSHRCHLYFKGPTMRTRISLDGFVDMVEFWLSNHNDQDPEDPEDVSHWFLCLKPAMDAEEIEEAAEEIDGFFGIDEYDDGSGRRFLNFESPENYDRKLIVELPRR